MAGNGRRRSTRSRRAPQSSFELLGTSGGLEDSAVRLVKAGSGYTVVGQFGDSHRRWDITTAAEVAKLAHDPTNVPHDDIAGIGGGAGGTGGVDSSARLESDRAATAKRRPRLRNSPSSLAIWGTGEGDGSGGGDVEGSVRPHTAAVEVSKAATAMPRSLLRSSRSSRGRRRERPSDGGAAKDSRPGTASATRSEVIAWGWNASGQCGIGEEGDVWRPAQLEAFDKAATHILQVSSGSFHTAAVTTSGSTYVWGKNDIGRLGLGDSSPAARTHAVMPTLVPLLGNIRVTQVSCGGSHTLALTDGGRVLSWGQGRRGQLGAVTRHDAEAAPAPAGVAPVGFGKGHRRRSDLDAFQLSPVIESPSPRALPEPTRVVSLKAGFEYSVAVDASGRVWSWGAGDTGQLGTGSNVDELLPRQVTLPPEAAVSFVSRIACGDRHTLLLLSNGLVLCCGDAEYGRLGLSEDVIKQLCNDGKGFVGTDHRYIHVLVSIPHFNLANRERPTDEGDADSTDANLSIPRIIDIAAGGASSLAIASNGSLYTWGANDSGQLGVGHDRAEWTPQLVTRLDAEGIGVTAADVGQDHMVALSTTGNVYCWGRVANGRLGVPKAVLRTSQAAWGGGLSSSYHAFPHVVPALTISMTRASTLSAGGAHTVLAALPKSLAAEAKQPVVTSPPNCVAWGDGIRVAPPEQGGIAVLDIARQKAEAASEISNKEIEPIRVGGWHSFTVECRDDKERARTSGEDVLIVRLQCVLSIRGIRRDKPPAGGSHRVVDNFDGTYTVWYQPDEEGEYEVHVDVRANAHDGELVPRQAPIRDSPFRVLVQEAKPDDSVNDPFVASPARAAQSMCSAKGRSTSNMMVGQRARVKIEVRDCDGQLLPGRDLRFAATLLPHEGNSELAAEPVEGLCRNQGDGTYWIEFLPRVAGTSTMKIGLDVGHSVHPIKGSPWDVEVSAGAVAATKCTASGSGLQADVFARRRAEFTIFARDEFSNPRVGFADSFSVSVSPVSDADVPSLESEGTVDSNRDGTYSASYEVPTLGRYYVAVFLRRKHVRGSPFLIEALEPPIEPPDPEKCGMRGPSLEGAIAAGSSTFLEIDAMDAFGCVVPLDAGVKGEVEFQLAGGQLERLQVSNASSTTLRVDFVIAEAGVFPLAVYVRGVCISATDCTVSVVDAHVHNIHCGTGEVPRDVAVSNGFFFMPGYFCTLASSATVNLPSGDEVYRSCRDDVPLASSWSEMSQLVAAVLVRRDSGLTDLIAPAKQLLARVGDIPVSTKVHLITLYVSDACGGAISTDDVAVHDGRGSTGSGGVTTSLGSLCGWLRCHRDAGPVPATTVRWCTALRAMLLKVICDNVGIQCSLTSPRESGQPLTFKATVYGAAESFSPDLVGLGHPIPATHSLPPPRRSDASSDGSRPSASAVRRPLVRAGAGKKSSKRLAKAR